MYVHLGNWVSTSPVKSGRKIRLFCLPYAGGGASTYLGWQRLVSSGVEVCPIRLPGREMRMKEPFITDRKTMVTSITAALTPFLKEPYALFGHSMGGFLAFEVACEIRTRMLPLPRHLFVSARPAPEVTRTLLSRPVAELSDAELLAEIAGSVNASLQELDAQPELKSLVLPILRNDFQLLEGYRFVPREPLRVGITAFGGISDSSVSEKDLRLWSSCTTAGFAVEMLEGDHFFINQTERIAAAVNRKIESLLLSSAQVG